MIIQLILLVNNRILYFQANWYKSEQYCRFHGMHLASINSGDEQKNLEEHIQSFGKIKFLYDSKYSIAWVSDVHNIYFSLQG